MSAIILFEEKHVRRVWNQAEEKWYFAIADVIAALTESVDPGAYWRKLKERLKKEGNQTVTDCHALKMAPAEYRDYKSLAAPGENLRDNMTDLDLIFTMLGEASTTEIARKKDAQGLPANQRAARAGGTIAGNARRELKLESGTKISTPANFKALTQRETKALRAKKPKAD